MTPGAGDRAATAIRALYGEEPIDARGVLHVAAVWASPDARLFNMRIVEATPESDTDAFALAVARARAEVIVTTGRILREEPGLHFDAPGERGAELRAWRRSRLGLDAPPVVAVLTRGPGLDPTHPALVGRRVVVLTGHDAAREAAGATAPGCTGRPGAAPVDEPAGGAAGPRSVEWVGRDAPGLLDALTFLREERGFGRVLVEAGPSTSRALYAVPGHVDELLLSICRAARLPDGVRADAFPGEAELRAAGLVETSRAERAERSGPWTFTRWRRR